MNPKRLLLTLMVLAIPLCVQAQTLRVLESNFYFDSQTERLEAGLIIDERTADVYCNSRFVGNRSDSADIDLVLYDPQTGERLPFLAVYAVHREGKGIVIDSMVWEYGPDNYRALRLPGRREQLLVAVTAGYRPVLLEYSPKTTPPQGHSLIDIEVSEEEFFKALERANEENCTRTDRLPDDADTTIHTLTISKIAVDDTGFTWYDADILCLEMAAGDYCVTRLIGDTLDMHSCAMSLSVRGYLFGGINMQWGSGDPDMPAYIVVYPLLPDDRHVGKPYTYQTTPEWTPSGCHAFWGPYGWFYVEGYDSKNDRYVYHRLHIR